MNQIDLAQRVAVVTGGAQGIGYAIAQRMLRSGATLVLWDRDAAQLSPAQESLSALGPVSTHRSVPFGFVANGSVLLASEPPASM